MSGHDEALAALRAAYDASGDVAVDFTLVTACYEIERRYQFEKDRDIPMSRLSSRVAVAVEEELQRTTHSNAPNATEGEQ